MKNDNNGSVYIWGAVLGMGLGLVSAYLFKRAAEENGGEKSLSTGDLIKLGLVLVGAVRQIAEAGSKVGKNDS